MPDIDIGSAAVDRNAAVVYNATYLLKDNPANCNGQLQKVEIWPYISLTGCKVGTFYGSGADYTCRDSHTIGNVTAGSKRTFTGLSIEVRIGDLIGIYFSSGRLEKDENPGGSGFWYDTSDHFGSIEHTYIQSSPGDELLSLWGEGDWQPPQIETRAATNVTGTTATLNGYVISDGGCPTETSCRFRWGLDLNYLSGTALVGNYATGESYSLDIDSLQGNTLYHFVAYAINQDGTDYGEDLTFTTSYAPQVTTDAETGVTSSAATLNGTVDDDGMSGAGCDAYFQWGLLTDDPTDTTAHDKVTGQSYSQAITIDADKIYHFRAAGDNDYGTGYGEWSMFLSGGTIAGDELPQVLTIHPASSITDTGAVIKGKLTDDGYATPNTNYCACYIEWGLTTAYGDASTSELKLENEEFSATLTGLTAELTYHYRAVAVNAIGFAYGDDKTFTASAEEAECEIWRLAEVLYIPWNETITIEADYDYPVSRIIQPVIGSAEDYYAYDTPSGGTAMPWYLGVTITEYAKGAKIALTNQDPYQKRPIYVTYFRIRGMPLKELDYITRRAEDTTSQGLYQKRTLAITRPWIPSATMAGEYADYLLGRYKDPQPQVTVTLKGKTDALKTQILARKVSDKVTIQNTKLGLDEDYYINKCVHKITEAGLMHEVTWTLVRASDEDYWKVGSSALGTTTRLGYG